MNQLRSDEYPAFYATYIDTVIGDVKEVLDDQLTSFPQFINTIPEDKAAFAYAVGKWTIKEVIGHVIDTERIMAYRALRFARNDTKALLGFEQDDYVAHARFNERNLVSLREEFTFVRQGTLALFNTFNETERSRKGLASERLISVRAFHYIIAGHLNHHRNIIRARYL